jgi:hypothetical protein
MHSVTHSSRSFGSVATQRQIVVHATSSTVSCGVSHAAIPRQTTTAQPHAFPRIPVIFGCRWPPRQVSIGAHREIESWLDPAERR